MGGSGKKKGNKCANSPSIDPQLQRSFDIAVRLKAEREQREALAAKTCSETTSPLAAQQNLKKDKEVVTETSIASRSKAKTNGDAIIYAAGVLETSQTPSSNTTSTEGINNDLGSVGLNTSEVVSNEATPMVCALSGKGKDELYDLKSFNPSSTGVGINLEVPEDWEASPIAQQFSSLLDSNEIRKHNRRTKQTQFMEGQSDGDSINFKSEKFNLDIQEAQEPDMDVVQNHQIIGFNLKSQINSVPELFVGND